MADAGDDAASLSDRSEFGARRTRWISKGVEILFGRLPREPARDGVDADVLIVGSGYGGAVAADRLAGRREDGKPLKVMLLERGREYLPGAFPSRAAELPGYLRYTTPNGEKAQGRLDGLFDLRLGADMSVVLANGLGGGSLINAGVMLVPKDEVFEDPCWDALPCSTDELKRRADLLRAELGAVPRTALEPSDPLRDLHRSGVMRNLGAAPVPITVALHGGCSSGGVQLNACVHCGDCATGCNHGAKVSLDVNLLRRAAHRGVELFSGATVSRVRRSGKVWEAEVWHTDATLRQRMAGSQWVRARRIILAAGTLGSTEILLRSQNVRAQQRGSGLHFSHRLGRGFSGNGDVLATVFDAEPSINGVADEVEAPASRRVGPTITSMIDFRSGDAGFVVQDLAVPGPLRRLFEEASATSALLHRIDKPDAHRHVGFDEPGSERPDPMAVDPDKVKRSMVVALICRDAAKGVMTLVPDDVELPRDAGLRIDWKCARADPRIVAAHKTFDKRLERLNDREQKTRRLLLPNPLWELLPPNMIDLLATGKGPLLTVHPLGGCAIGRDRDHGVVNGCGEVFDADEVALDAVHDGLIVLDGSIVPTSLGINPALTIATLADLAIEQLIGCWRLTPAEDSATQDPPQAPRPVYRVIDPNATPPAPKATKVQVIERLAGTVDFVGKGAHWVELDLLYENHDLFPDGGAPGHRPAYTQQGHLLKVADSAILSRLRIFNFERPESRFDLNRPDSDALLVAPLTAAGTLRFFHREASDAQARRKRARCDWFWNRGLRDVAQMIQDWCRRKLRGLWAGLIIPAQRLATLRRRSAVNIKVTSDPASERQAHGQPVVPLGTRLGNWVKWLWHCLKKPFVYWRQIGSLATRAGEARLFDYCLPLGKPTSADGPFADLKDVPSLSLVGRKRLTYNRRGNPWTQLMRMEIESLAGLTLGERRSLEVCPAYFAGKAMPLMRIVEQQDQPSALTDLLAFAAYLARVTINIHLWTFRKPDTAIDPPTPNRLPAALPCLPAPEVMRFRPDGANDDGEIQLTCYRRKPGSERPPVLMIHGYSASGTTFAHPQLDPSLAEYLWHQGVEPWIVDLRSSCGMPTAERPYSFEEIALNDIPAAIRRVCGETGFAQIDVVSHCMGSAMLTMTLQAVNPCGPQTAARIRCWVMSQFGPRLRFSPANVLRAHLLGYFVQLMPNFRYSLRPGDQNVGVDGNMYDRFVASIPYLDDERGREFDRENPLWPPWCRTPWVGTRHRLDALIGRTFDVRQMTDDALEHIDDFFGPLSLVTMSQPLYFAQMGEPTAFGGAQLFGRDAAPLLRHVHMLSLHGGTNGLADPDTANLLRRWHANHPEMKLGAYRMFEDRGHQDLLMGRDCGEIFDVIASFLKEPAMATKLDAIAPPDGLSDRHKNGEIVHAVANNLPGNRLLGILVVPVVEVDDVLKLTADWTSTLQRTDPNHLPRDDGAKCDVSFDFTNAPAATAAVVLVLVPHVDKPFVSLVLPNGNVPAGEEAEAIEAALLTQAKAGGLASALLYRP